jgi:uncharacterized lipoprotein YajG
MRILKILSLAGTLFLLAGCSLNKKTSVENPVPPTTEQAPEPGYLQGMVNVKKKAEGNIKNATDAENQRLQEAIK